MSDWKVDEDGEILLQEEDIAQRNERKRQIKYNMKTILYNLSKEHPEIVEKIRKKSKNVPLTNVQPDLEM